MRKKKIEEKSVIKRIPQNPYNKKITEGFRLEGLAVEKSDSKDGFRFTSTQLNNFLDCLEGEVRETFDEEDKIQFVADNENLNYLIESLKK